MTKFQNVEALTKALDPFTDASGRLIIESQMSRESIEAMCEAIAIELTSKALFIGERTGTDPVMLLALMLGGVRMTCNSIIGDWKGGSDGHVKN